MFCKTCEYPLWNLETRTCPECGTDFAPSQFEFAPESVRFLCPGCRQEYYGTGRNGHLVPRAFDCVRCGRALEMDQMILIPREGVPEQRTRAEIVPWIERKRVGFFKGWFGTIGMAIGSPVRLARAMPESAGSVEALWYVLLTQILFGIVGMSLFLFFPLVGLFASGFSGGSVLSAVTGIVFGMVSSLASIAALIGLWTLIAHALLIVTGKSSGGIGVSFSTICYASGANFFSAIPCIGFYLLPFGLLWWVIVAGMMGSVRHQVSGWRAAIAFVIPPAAISAGALALLVWWVVTLTSAMPGLMGGAPYATKNARSIYQDLIAYQARTGAYPAHAGLLLSTSQYVDETTFETEYDAFGSSPAPFLGSATRSTLELMPTPQLDQLLQNEIAAMPADVVAHRIGDVVFTYHGMDPTQHDPGLWVLVSFGPYASTTFTTSPSGAVTPITSGPPDFIIAATLDGSFVELDPDTWIQDLADQNALRALEGLPALPDLQLVTPTSPAGPAP